MYNQTSTYHNYKGSNNQTSTYLNYKGSNNQTSTYHNYKSSNNQTYSDSYSCILMSVKDAKII